MSKRKTPHGNTGNAHAAKPDSEKRSTRLPHIRVVPDQLERYKAAAERKGEKLATWVRQRLDSAAEE